MTSKLNTPDIDLIELSGKWVYRHPDKGERLKVNGNNYVVKAGEYNKSSGLDYMIVENTTTGEISMVFEGTQGTQDFLTDGTLPGSIPNTQLREADAAYKKESQKYNIKNVAGNSLGGGLSNYVASKNDGIRSVTYNPAILPKGTYNKNNPRITNYLSEYDPLTLGERGMGYGNRLPGESHILQNNVPWLQTILSNHTGYDDAGVTVNGKNIPIDADAYLPVGIWSGQVLTGGGKGQKIDINPDNIRILANSLRTRMMEQIKRGQFYLDTAVDLVNDEGNYLDDRTTALQETFDNLLAEGEFGGIITSLANYAEFRDEMEKAKPVSYAAIDFMQRVRTLPILGEVLDVVSGSFFHALDLLVDIPALVNDLALRTEDMMDQVSKIKMKAIPELFKGINDQYLSDAMVTELKEHYKILDENKDLVVKQILTFSSQVTYVSNELEKADKLLSATQKVQSVGAPPATQAYVLKESKALKDGMGKKQRLLNRNFRDFSAKTTNLLMPILSSIRSITNQLKQVIKSAIRYLEDLQTGLSIVKIPFTDRDYQLKEELREYIRKLQEILLTVRGVGSAVKDMESNLEHVLAIYRPYIDTALFEGTKFQDVILLNKAATNIFHSAELVFGDIKHQLSGNTSAAISALDKLALQTSNNMKSLLEQVKRGSIHV
ncbi:SA1320 family protein [Listeria monocytogenes]